MMRSWTLLLSCAWLLFAAEAAAQEAYPAKPVKIVVPFPAAGNVDFLGRLFAEHFTHAMGQTFIVENRPGAGTNIGSAAVAKSAPDGYTLLLGGSANSVNMTLYKAPGYDIVKDFVPIAAIATVPNILLARPGISVKSIEELRDLSRSRSLSFASAGVGTPSHIAGEQFMRAAGMQMLHVPYKGAPAAATDVMAGRGDLLFATIPATLGNIKSGRLIPIAVAGTTRSPAVPEVPTFSELGLRTYEASAWYGFLSPAGTPAEVVRRLSAEINRLLASREVVDRLIENGAVPLPPSSPAEFAEFIKKDVESSRALVKKAGIEMQ